jgi:hypothetical protein
MQATCVCVCVCGTLGKPHSAAKNNKPACFLQINLSNHTKLARSHNTMSTLPSAFRDLRTLVHDLQALRENSEVTSKKVDMAVAAALQAFVSTDYAFQIACKRFAKCSADMKPFVCTPVDVGEYIPATVTPFCWVQNAFPILRPELLLFMPIKIKMAIPAAVEHFCFLISAFRPQRLADKKSKQGWLSRFMGADADADGDDYADFEASEEFTALKHGVDVAFTGRGIPMPFAWKPGPTEAADPETATSALATTEAADKSTETEASVSETAAAVQ